MVTKMSRKSTYSLERELSELKEKTQELEKELYELKEYEYRLRLENIKNQTEKSVIKSMETYLPKSQLALIKNIFSALGEVPNANA